MSAAKNSQVSFTIAVTDADNLQWQADKGDGKGWVNLEEGTTWQGVTTDTLTFTATNTRATYQYRCVVSNSAGSVESDVVTLTIGVIIEIDDVVYEALTDTTCKVTSYKGTSSSIVIPEMVQGMTVTEIGEEAFMNNETIVSIDLPDTVIVIRARAFKGCTQLSEMK